MLINKARAAACIFSSLLITAVHAENSDEHAISRDEVNLLRVKGERITDVVYDPALLEVTADKDHGIVYVRVKKDAAENLTTTAFVNTEHENIPVRLAAVAGMSKTVELIPREKPQATRTEAATFAASLAPFEASDYVEEIKTLVKAGFAQKLPDTAFDKRAVSPEPQSAVVPLTEGSVRWRGFRVREVFAYATADKIVEKLVFTRMGAIKEPDAAKLTGVLPGVLACGILNGELQTQAVVVRARSVVTADDWASFETALDTLAGDTTGAVP